MVFTHVWSNTTGIDNFSNQASNLLIAIIEQKIDMSCILSYRLQTTTAAAFQ